MKNCFKKAFAFVLIFVLVLVSGCKKDSGNNSSLINTGDDLSHNDVTTSEKSETHDLKDVFIPEEQKTNSSAISSKNETSSDEASLKTETIKEEDSLKEKIESGEIKLPEINFKALWISYYEFPFWGSTEEIAKQKFDEMIKKAADQGYTDVFCHVRANADAFYPSKYFPFAMQLTGEVGKDPGYDPLEIMIWATKKHGLEFHAWINPYRVSNVTTNPDELAEGHIAAKWLADGSNRAVVHKNGIYFNPSSTDVQRLVLFGIREVLENYEVDGIHFDDYFYPEHISAAFDAKQYAEYKQNASKPLSLGNWRRANINALVSAVYRLCHSYNVVFGISPAANISLDNSHDNYKLLYADTALWMRQEGYIDYILPQLYFGYKHPVEKSRYGYLLNIWASLPKHKKLKFYVGLGAYRMNEDSEDKEEWHNESDLMARQAVDAVRKGADGIAVFSYTASTSEEPHNVLQIKNMFEILK